jgi:hypothetical protein
MPPVQCRLQLLAINRDVAYNALWSYLVYDEIPMPGGRHGQ